MTEFATVDRYCSIEDNYCHKNILYQGSWSFFFAYPSDQKWRDFSDELVKQLASRGMLCTRWEDLINNELLFSKVCDGIYGHDFLLAEVTDPNPNVLLEIGYALSVGRQPILLKNRNIQDWSRKLLTSLEGCYYETREDIYSHIAKVIDQPRSIPEAPDRRLPILEQMGIYIQNEDPGTVYHLKPKLSTDWINRVDRTLKKSYFKLSAMDPSDSIYDEFFPQARQIQRASLIVASLVSSDYKEWQQHNANVALLIGFAIGLGKRVLVLQEEPLKPILDLGSVARPFESEKQAEDVVSAWIRIQTQALVSRRVESDRKAETRQREDKIRSIYLGHPDALQDNRLLDYFVPTKEFEDAVEGRRTIYFGRRGSGKSANVQAIKAELEQKTNTVMVEIAPDDFELERIGSFLERECELVNPRLLFQHVWHYILTSEIVKTIAETTDLLYLSPNDRIRNDLRRHYDAKFELFDQDFGSRVITVLDEIIDRDPNLNAVERQARGEDSIKTLRDYQLARLLRDFAKDERLDYFVVADDLDKHWRPDTQQSVDLLVGLVAEVGRIQRYFGECLKIVLFLREDIYDVLTQFDDDLSKRNCLRIDWTVANLKHLVAERLSSAADEVNENDEKTWATIFPDPVQNRSAMDYIVSRALPRPRDVLDFCQRAIDQAQRNGHSTVTSQDVLDGEISFSEGVFWSVASEFKGLYPQLEHILIEFAGIGEITTWQDFELHAFKAIQANLEVFDEWVISDKISPELLANVLFSIGVIGLSRNMSNAPHFCNGRTFTEVWGLVAPAPTVHIHPAFRKVLDVSGVIQRRSLRGRRREESDPRQLSFQD